ncbi:MAG: hypothetical protein KBS63_03535 [Clostridiales bacterium]|nr:hypothetical protein [Candidatus Crickella caballi]
MKKNKTNLKSILKIILGLIVLTLLAAFIYSESKMNLLDKEAFNSFSGSFEKSCEDFSKQEDVMSFIKNWADENELKYKTDDNGNLIFSHKSIKRKKDVAPTVIMVNCNYEDCYDSRSAITTAAMVAYSNIRSGKYTVIFANNINNSEDVYYGLDRALFPDGAKVIYLDAGKAAYVSASSFARKEQTVSVPSEKEAVHCDTAVRVRISGLTSDSIGTSAANHPNPIAMLSTVLTRLNSKSFIYQISDIKIGNRGNMYPDSMEATFLINSYAVGSLTGYLDKRVKAFNKAYKDDYPDAEYSYEVIDDISDLPEEAYTADTAASLTTLLYALNNGNYRFDEDAVLPNGYEVGDVYAINCVRQLRIDEYSNIYVDISTQALNNDFMKEILNENREVCKLSGCKVETVNTFKKFRNDKNSLILTLKNTYFKVKGFSLRDSGLEEKKDTYFTPMSYLADINESMDIVHIKTTNKKARAITTMILCYVQTSGNFLSL